MLPRRLFSYQNSEKEHTLEDVSQSAYDAICICSVNRTFEG
jgi:hypothetical protein